jgi:hypothetical protein
MGGPTNSVLFACLLVSRFSWLSHRPSIIMVSEANHLDDNALECRRDASRSLP